jgi:steroid delta-isomerase-like uncharacterized protein
VGLDSSLRQLRKATVLEHMEAENAHDFDRCIAAFAHPRYEIVATGEVWDGHSGVNTLLNENKTGFSDFRFNPTAMHHADDAVIVEANLYGTHKGPLRGLPPTGRKFEMRFCAVFVFEEDRLVCERVYFDQSTVLRQLGIAHDPTSALGRAATALNHPVTVGRAVVRQLARR